MNISITLNATVKTITEHVSSTVLIMLQRCELYGVPGMSTERKFEPEFQKMMKSKPKYVYLLLGGIDIRWDSEVSQIVTRIEHIVQRMKKGGVRKVFISSIVQRGSFPSWTGLDKHQFDKIRKAINSKLSLKYKEDFVNMEKKLKFSKHYDEDLVHPGYKEGGMKVLNTVIKTCFLKYT